MSCAQGKMKGRRRACVAACLLSLPSACTPSGSARSAEAEQREAKERAAIAELFTARCGKCHTPVARESSPRGDFEAVLERHKKQKRLHLTEQQWHGMLEYLAPAE